MSDEPESPRVRRARRVGLGVYVAAVTTLALICTVQITQQVFFPAAPVGPAPFDSCADGIRALDDAIRDGRRAADLSPSPDGDQDPEVALLRFRRTVAPTWAHREEVERLCGPERQGLLDALEQLRYSEEHGVRHQAIELAGLRRRVRRLLATQLSSAAPASSSKDRPADGDRPAPLRPR